MRVNGASFERSVSATSGNAPLHKRETNCGSGTQTPSAFESQLHGIAFGADGEALVVAAAGAGSSAAAGAAAGVVAEGSAVVLGAAPAHAARTQKRRGDGLTKPRY